MYTYFIYKGSIQLYIFRFFKSLNLSSLTIRLLLISSDAPSVWPGWGLAHWNLGVHLILFQRGEADYAHHIASCPPGLKKT